jgi:hypothetical protein
MHISIPRKLREALGLSPVRDEGLLAGPPEAAVRAVGAPEPVISLFGQDISALCPDLVHEAQWGLSHRD